MNSAQRRTLGLLAVCLVFPGCDGGLSSRLDQIRARGHLVCGVSPGIAGFATVDSKGGYRGLDVDICRAVAAAVLGSSDSVRFVLAQSVEDFLQRPEIDIVSRRLTWTLPREGMGLLFGPIVFYDGQGFLVRRRDDIAARTDDVPDVNICVVGGSVHEFNLNAYSASVGTTLRKVAVRDLSEAVASLTSGACGALTADRSALAALRSQLPRGADFELLDTTISKEPLAQVVRQGDDQFFSILRWTVNALVLAEELGVTSANAEEKRRSSNLDIRLLLGVVPGGGQALGLDDQWAFRVITSVGNYGELFERNVGEGSALGLPRGLNALWTAGGLMYAPILRR